MDALDALKGLTEFYEGKGFTPREAVEKAEAELDKRRKHEEELSKSKHEEELTKTVRIYIGDTITHSVITFKSTERPLETVKNEVIKQILLKRNMVIDPFRLVTSKNETVTSFESIRLEPFLVFHIPDKIVPLSGNEWCDVQLTQLKVSFRDVDLIQFFNNLQINEQTSARGVDLLKKLEDMDDSLYRKYVPTENNGADGFASAKAIRSNPMLQDPICKALFAVRKYASHESFVDDFVKHLLDEMGFNEGSLYVAPQMRMKLFYGETEKMATADLTIIDLLSYARIGVVEDKNWQVMMLNVDSTAQLVAEGIAIAQCNDAESRKRDNEGNAKAGNDASTTSLDPEVVYGIRVTGSMFHFYALHLSPAIRTAMSTLSMAATTTTMSRYKSERGLNFLAKEDRAEIIQMLSILQDIAKKTGETSPRRSSKVAGPK